MPATLYSIADARRNLARHFLARQTGKGVAAFIVAQDPVAALAIARDLERQGDDTTELFYAALAALTPPAKDCLK